MMSTAYQRARRHAYWKGCSIALLAFASWIAVASWAGTLTGS